MNPICQGEKRNANINRSAFHLLGGSGGREGKKDNGICVFVLPEIRNGFMEPGLDASAKDLQKALEGYKFRVVGLPDMAHIIVVTQRSTDSMLMGDMTAKKMKRVWARIQIGDFTKTFEGHDSLMWRDAASYIAGDIEKWAKVNKSSIINR
jgi:hypothetical protein